MNRLFARALAATLCLLPLTVACTSSSVINEAEPPEPASADITEPAAPEEPADPADPADPAKAGDPGKTSIDASGGGLKPVAAAKGAKDGDSCDKHDDCASGVCEGEGCGAKQGKCAAKERQCTMDLRQYCGCDGKTFQGGGNCPKNRFAKKGACEGDPMGPVIKKP